MSTAKAGTNTLLPAHIGIIMDGNGRWAKQRGFPRSNGHLEGLKATKRVVKAATELGVRFLTLYAFSTENWKRSSEEVGFLMGLINKYLIAELDFFRENKIRIRHSGDLDGLPQNVVSGLKEVIADTARYEGLTVSLAINYGGRDEIVRAVRKAISDGITAEALSEKSISDRLDNPDIPDPDLIIRTASEQRTSNFLLWEAAYAEFYFSDKLWPDWDKSDLSIALDQYARRDRRFGGITE